MFPRSSQLYGSDRQAETMTEARGAHGGTETKGLSEPLAFALFVVDLELLAEDQREDRAKSAGEKIVAREGEPEAAGQP